jgi:hypothetical protein
MSYFDEYMAQKESDDRAIFWMTVSMIFVMAPFISYFTWRCITDGY